MERRTLDHLVGRDVSIVVSDPWQFGAEVGTGPFEASIRRVFSSAQASQTGHVEEERVLLQLARPFKYDGLKCEHLLAAPRLEGPWLDSLDAGNEVATNLMRVSEERTRMADPFHSGPSRERGFALIGSIRAL